MLTIQSIKTNIYTKNQQNNNYFIKNKNDFVTFSGNLCIGKLPSELKNINLASINKNSKNVQLVNTTGYLAEIIKYFSPSAKKNYAIKRVFSPDKAKHQTANPVEQTRIEANIYKRLGRIKNIPKFYYYKGNWGDDAKNLLDNYLILDWVDGVQASEKGIFYNPDLVNSKTLGKLYKTLAAIDKVGVIHNDLWAGNILFKKNDVNLIDFNRSYTFNPQKQIKENNIDSFKTRFVNRFLSDTYQRCGEKKLLETYKICLKAEINYYKSKQFFYFRAKNNNGFLYYKQLADKLNLELKNQEILKQNAIKTVFESDINCAEIFAKYFEFQDDETSFHFQKALNILNNYPEIINKNKADEIKTNIEVVNKLNNLVKYNGSNKDFENLLKVFNNQRKYSVEEKKKPYYDLYRRFCEFNIKWQKSSDSKEKLKQEYADLFKIKRLKEYFENLFNY